jgi:CTP:molybdopterin cytidylyltransferase MocA
MRVAGILLSGGRSSRMGRPKALLDLDGETFLARTLRTLEAAGIDDVVIVTGAHDEEIRRACNGMALMPGVRIVTNPAYDQGQLSSILTGLDALAPHHPDAALVALVDQPRVAAPTVVALVEAFHATRAPVVRPAFQGRHGHPVLFSAEVFDALRTAPRDEGAKSVVHAAGERVVTVPVDDEGVVLDIDTPEDYARLLRGTGPGPSRD